MVVKNRNARVEIDDLAGFLRNIGVIPTRVRAAERAFQRASATVVARKAKIAAQSGSRIQAKSAGDIRESGTAGTVVFGGKGYSMGAEFGAYRYKQFKTWKGSGDSAGYFFWPTIREFREKDMADQWTKDVFDVIRRAFAN